MRRGIVVLAVAALLCGCRQEDATTREEPKAVHYEAPVAVEPVPAAPPENVPGPEPVPPEAPSH